MQELGTLSESTVVALWCMQMNAQQTFCWPPMSYFHRTPSGRCIAELCQILRFRLGLVDPFPVMMGLCCKRPEILQQLLLCFQPVLRSVGARRHHGTAIYCCVDQCGNSILTGEFNMFQNALALKLGFYMALPTATQNITAHIHVHTFYHYSWIHVGRFGQIRRIRTRPGRIQAHLHLASLAEQGPWKRMPWDAMGCHMALGQMSGI